MQKADQLVECRYCKSVIEQTQKDDAPALKLTSQGWNMILGHAPGYKTITTIYVI